MATKKKQTVVLYPFPGVGHIVPMVQLAKVFLRHGYDVTVVLIEPPSGFGAGDVARSNPSISFHVLPRIPDPVESAGNKPPFLVMLELMRRYNDELQEFLLSIPRRQRLHSLVTSMFTAHAVDVAAKLRVPVYTFFASPAAVLAVVTQLPALLAGRTTGLKELGETPLEFLGVPPFPASHIMPEVLEHPEEEFCKAIVDVWKRNTDTDGVLVNTFELLESRAVQALRDPHQCVVPGRVLPPIYCVGPLVNGDKDQAESKLASSIRRRHECLQWLDAQPETSVVFLCFGSRGVLSVEQLKEIAVGLDKSGHRFLWTVRKPAGESEKDLDDILPAGFLERTKGRGIVVESWAPQTDVLRHPSTAAFVTHCGWNSTLEAITAGVPMLCWPLYAEQMLNKVLITEDMGLGLEMKGYKAGFITAEEVEAKMRLVLESEEGGELRKRIAARKEEAEMALQDGGSSQVAFAKFLSDVNNLREHDSRSA
ncbi:hypothetical protein PR202_ga16868 [Eleusine coracana subsp. coracana]|uniref:Glycosyltransferase n=1 Tax=Eleusine coracana subsp. coracana TaxID=191504 RepID=A0AAV5CPC7_ELECO|nr:hypothetical protein QOZ80_6AG0521080 [Eleusine coracana subsp. coracana]GJM99739.1 hypothetical protein PR202_ga16868 [Eleusine coracana subsp. coracana]